jgi:quercetin dioxygenase-like cupin family protein
MPRPREMADLARRDILLLGLAGASALVLGAGPRVHAGETPGIERKVLTEVDSTIQGYAKIRVRETTFHPGVAVPVSTMQNAMICECTEGTLEVTNDGRTFTANKGQVWTCHVGGTEGAANKGQSLAVMRIIDLLPA